MSVELGIFARTFPRATPSEVAAAIANAGFGITQLNLSSVGLPTVPPHELKVDFDGIGSAFAEQHVRVWGVSATYNMVHPDLVRRHSDTTNAQELISKVPALGTEVVTLCTGSRDATNMWRRHPDNDRVAAWLDLRASLDQLLGAAEQAGLRLGIEPEPSNVVADAARARRLLNELGRDAHLVGIVLDPANLVTPTTAVKQGAILRAAFDQLGGYVVALHAKDVVDGGGYAAAGVGALDYDLIFELHAELPRRVPVIIQDVAENDVARTRDFLLHHARTYA